MVKEIEGGSDISLAKGQEIFRNDIGHWSVKEPTVMTGIDGLMSIKVHGVILKLKRVLNSRNQRGQNRIVIVLVLVVPKIIIKHWIQSHRRTLTSISLDSIEFTLLLGSVKQINV